MNLASRRDFLVAAAAAPMLVHAADEPPVRLNIGVGTFSYHTLSLDDMIVQLRTNNVREVEMSRGEFMLLAQRPTQAMVEGARRRFDAADIRCVSYYTATLRSVDDVELAIRYARILGAMHVSGDATEPILSEIDRRFTEAGLTFGIHNHWFPTRFAYATAEDVLRAIAPLSKTVGSTLDIGQMAACGEDPVLAISRLRSRLLLVHLKDVAEAGAEHNVLLGTGIAKVAECMTELKRVRFTRLVALEFEKDGDSNDDVRNELAYARARA